ncbi:alpha/beta hydrolase [Sphingorhabdus sp. EL138]|uniref:alpha/beta hydrolase n=1 Tax=Sphingorhabdus sp. EL138 TaxID=2073156 RepID=UPI0025DAB5DF|nr:alpha/beta hydrolase [Sphingorhabdus sp. EL138]
MIKYNFIALLLALVGSGLWFWSKTDPQKLDFADRMAPGPAEYHKAPLTNVAYGDDARQKLDIYLPKPNAVGGSAVLIFFHGGSWRDGEREGYGFLGRAFAARGFVTVIADYRKAPRVRFPAFVEDTAAAIAWVHANIAKHNGDAERIFVMGHSAGAHIAMMTALDPQWLAAKNLTPDVIKGVIGLAGPYDFLPLTTKSSQIALGQWPDLTETQPITFARADAPPLLLLTGDKDTVVKPRNSKILSAKIQALGGQQQLQIYPDVDHADIIMAVARPFRQKAPVVADVVNFINAR